MKIKASSKWERGRLAANEKPKTAMTEGQPTDETLSEAALDSRLIADRMLFAST